MAALWLALVRCIGVESQRSPWLTCRYQRIASAIVAGVAIVSARSLPGWKELAGLWWVVMVRRGVGRARRRMAVLAAPGLTRVLPNVFWSSARSASIAARRSAQCPRRKGAEP